MCRWLCEIVSLDVSGQVTATGLDPIDLCVCNDSYSLRPRWWPQPAEKWSEQTLRSCVTHAGLRGYKVGSDQSDMVQINIRLNCLKQTESNFTWWFNSNLSKNKNETLQNTLNWETVMCRTGILTRNFQQNTVWLTCVWNPMLRTDDWSAQCAEEIKQKHRKILINPYNRLRQGQSVRFNDLLDDIEQKVGEADEWVWCSLRSIHKKAMLLFSG